MYSICMYVCLCMSGVPHHLNTQVSSSSDGETLVHLVLIDVNLMMFVCVCVHKWVQ